MLRTLFVVDVDRTGVFPSRALSQALGLENEEVVPGIDQALNRLSELRPGPRHVVIDIGVHGEDVLPYLDRMMRLIDPAARVVLIGNVNDLNFYRTLKQLGIHEYFTHPADIGEVARAFAQHGSNTRASINPTGADGKVIAFISAASGDGASTVALNTAYSLATDFQASTVLVDMDYQFGMIARHLDLPAQFGIRELFDNPERGVDATLVGKMLLPYRNGLRVVAAPNTLRLLPQVRPETVRDLIAVLKQQFNFVILDVPGLWTPWTAEALLQSDRVVVTAQLWLRSVTHLSRLFSAWQDIGIEKDRIMLAINRSGAKYREAITPQDFERVCLKNINTYLANDIKSVVAAENQGKTVLEVGPSALERQIKELARNLYALQGSGAAANASLDEPARKGLRALFERR